MVDESFWERVRPPLWARWAISLGVAAVLVVALIVFVSSHNGNGLATLNPHAVAREKQEANVVIGRDQAPHVAKLRMGASPHAAFVSAVRGDMRGLIAGGTISGPLQGVRCRRVGSRPGRQALSCTAKAADVNYPFVGVVTARPRRVTYCKRDLPPIPSQNIPVSSRCRL